MHRRVDVSMFTFVPGLSNDLIMTTAHIKVVDISIARDMQLIRSSA
jgi:hypothetical protein